MSANVDAMVREGINAYRAGNIEEARALLLKAVEINDQHEQAWLWLSAVVDSVEDRQTCLENVLTINPHNENARQGLNKLTQQSGSAYTPPASSPMPAIQEIDEDEDPFANISFTDDSPSAFEPEPQITPFTTPADDDPIDDVEEELPHDTNWATPPSSSSSSAFHTVSEPTPDVLDDWVAGLNLNSGQANAFLEDTDDPFSASPFSTDLDLDLGENPHDALFGLQDDDPDDLPAVSTAFADDDDDDDAMFGGGPFDSADDYDDPFGSPEADPMRSPAVAKARVMSPAPTADDDDAILEIDDEDFDDFDDFDDDILVAIDPSEYFKSIPSEIKATRLPGSNERYPLLVILGLIVLLALNIGAVALLVSTLTTS